MNPATSSRMTGSQTTGCRTTSNRVNHRTARSGLSLLILAVLATLLLPWLPAGAVVVAQNSDRTFLFEEKLAADLVAEARRVLLRDDQENARFLLERAYTLYPESGDTLYLLASLEPRLTSTVPIREQMLRRAMTLPLHTVPRDALVEDLARLLVNSGRAHEAIELLDVHIRERSGTGAIHAAMSAVLANDSAVPQVSLDRSPPVLELLLMEALLESSPGWFSSLVLRRMRYRYPENLELAYLDWQRLSVLVPSYLEWLGHTKSRNTGRNRIMERILFHALDVVPLENGGLRDRLTRSYYEESGGTDPVPAVVALFGDSASTWIDADQGQDLWVEKRLWEMAGRFVPPREWPEALPEPLRNGYERVLSAPTVQVVRRQGSAYALELFDLEADRLVRWSRDADGNGLMDTVVEFGLSGDIRLYQRYDDNVLRIEFSPYPLVTGVQALSVVPGGVSRWTELEQDVPGGGLSSRWNPPSPVPYDPELRLRVPDGDSTVRSITPGLDPLRAADVLAGRVDLEMDDIVRFSRQLVSDDARLLSSVEVRDHAGYLRTLGMIR